MEKEYATKDIANITDIAESTVRKYAQLLESHGYVFNRNISGYRIFNKQDVEVFSEFKKMSNKGDKSVEETAKITADKYIVKPNTEDEPISDNIQSGQGVERAMLDDLMKKVDILTDINKKQIELNQELFKRLDEQQKYIDNRLEQRDQVLIESLKQSMEVQKQIATTQEEQKESKSFWKRLFNK